MYIENKEFSSECKIINVSEKEILTTLETTVYEWDIKQLLECTIVNLSSGECKELVEDECVVQK